jgi:ABC-type lipoprotein export system ATPase subunit
MSHSTPYLRNVTFAWNKPGTVSGSTTPGSGRMRDFRLTIEGEIAFKEGALNLICGPTGCGKTSLLMALLGAHIIDDYAEWS